MVAGDRSDTRVTNEGVRPIFHTARLMDEYPTLLRLKELETLEKVTEKVDKLTVFGRARLPLSQSATVSRVGRQGL